MPYLSTDPNAGDPLPPPMVAHQPTASPYLSTDPNEGEAPPREMTTFRGLRIARTGNQVEVNPPATDEDKAALLDQTGKVAIGAGVLGAGFAAPGISMGLLKALGNPYVAGGLAGAKTLITTHSPIAALASGVRVGAETAAGGRVLGAVGGLMSRLRGAEAVASVAPAIAEATAGLEEAAAPLAGRAYQGIPSLMNIAGTAPEDAAMAAQAARAADGARRASSIADMVQPAAQAAPMAPTGVAAATDLADTGGGASGYVAGLLKDKAVPAAKEAESLLETRLRASVLAKQNPQALTDEIVAKVQSLKEGVGKGLSAAQVGASIEDMYGLGQAQAHNMAKMIFSAMGYE